MSYLYLETLSNAYHHQVDSVEIFREIITSSDFFLTNLVNAFSKVVSMKDFKGSWSLKKTCNTIYLESKHPLTYWEPFIYTHECKDTEIAYFKVDENLIDNLPDAYLGIVRAILV